MARLIAERFLAGNSHHALDLATGQLVDIDACTVRPEREEPLRSLVEVLEHGREGSPRAVHASVSGRGVQQLLRRAAADASSRGFVPLAVDVYLRLRPALDELLCERSVLLLAPPSMALDRARYALIDAASRSPRPHVLLTCGDRSRGAGGVVREARTVYGTRTVRGRPLPPIDADVEYHLRRAAKARTFVQAGRHAAAERLLRDVIGALMRRDRLAHATRISIQLGQILLERGRAGAAEQAFADGATSAARIGDEALAIEARLWQATARIDAGRLTDAEAICRALLSGESLRGSQRAWTHSVLARVLIWQGRLSDTADLDLSLSDEHGLEEITAVHVQSTHVRLLLARERTFEAGLCAERLLGETAASSPATRLIASTAYLRFVASVGALELAGRTVEHIGQLARQARAPLREVRARAIWMSALLRGARSDEVRRLTRRLERWRAAAPALLRRAIDTIPREKEAGGRFDSRRFGHSADGPPRSCLTSMIAAAQDEASDFEAVRRVLERAAPLLGTSRIDVCSNDAGPVSIVASVGSGLQTSLGSRVLDTGLTLGPEAIETGLELGVPVRRGPQLVGAFVARWPCDRHPPSGSRDLLEMAAAIVGSRLEAAIVGARATSSSTTLVPELIGASSAIDDVRTAIVRAAAAPFNVLILGESGVGKELAARAIHQLSARRERRFCDINCAALPDELLESELFGHARGAFTGAVSDRAGLFEEADGGSIFLDEVADLSVRAQAKLLRVLQQQEVRRVGETFSRKVDVRFVTAANRDLSHEAAERRFREDLLYRLDVIRIRIPPLRERPGDISILAGYLWQQASARVGTTARLTHGVLSSLSRYHWPGNVRELQNVLAALAVAAPGRGEVRPQLLPGAIAGAAAVTSTHLAAARSQFEKRAIESALARAAGSRSRAARELGLSRQGLLKMMARLGIS